MLRTALLTLILMTPATAFANEVLIELTGKVEREYYGGKLCDLEFNLTNNSFGTLYRIYINVDGWDDRGEKFDELLSFSMDNSHGGWGGKTPVAKGTTQSFKGGSFKGSCKWLDKIKIGKLDNDDCNIRMMPEEVNCSDILKVLPGSTGLKID